MRASEDLKAEYLLIQGQYEAFDQRALSLKALATPLLGAGLAFGADRQSDQILYATILVAASLWCLEAIWKGFQSSLEGRIRLLEAWFRGDTFIGRRPVRPDEPPFQIYTEWQRSGRERWRRMLFVAPAPFVCLPYIVVIICGLIVIASTDCPTAATRSAPLPAPSSWTRLMRSLAPCPSPTNRS